MPDEYPAHWANLKALYVTLVKTEHTRDRRRETLSLALGNPDDFQYGLLKKLSDYFGVTYYEATCKPRCRPFAPCGRLLSARCL